MSMLPIHRLKVLVAIGVLAFLTATARAEEPLEGGHFNLEAPTLGGKQIWADVYVHAGWRIQENTVTGHARLLDDTDVRRAWGSTEQCRDTFEGFRKDLGLQHQSRHMVMLVHGLGRSAGSFTDLADELRGNGFEAIAVNYPSTRQGVATHADGLQRILSGLDGIDTVSFVTHSMGGLVVRELLSRPAVLDGPVKVDRVVMIAPPSRGSALADALKDQAAYQWLTTETGQDLTPGHAAKLEEPPVDFAVIAGGRGDDIGFNPFLDGDDDGVVTVKETRLDGAVDFLVVASPHGLVDNHPETVAAVRQFLRCGRFRCPAGDPR